MKNVFALISILALLFAAGTAGAGVSASDIDRLGNDLTPLGAEKAGNADGSIPEWTGGLTEAFPGWPTDDFYRPNPHADDKIKFTITKDNAADYADMLTDGAKAMLEAYPEVFKMNVYPTRRTAAYPQWYYDAIKAQASTAALIKDGNGVEGVWGAIPFPIPTTGVEVVWNHLLRFQGKTREAKVYENTVYANGSRLESTFINKCHFTFYNDGAGKAKYQKDGTIFLYSSQTLTPSRDAGEGILAHDNIDMAGKPRRAWTYDPAERRVRRAPNLAFDTPDRPINVIDDYDMFSGSPERYDWKLIGKKEIYVPYNNNEIASPRRSVEEVNTLGFLNADILRYELHRVWVVEATIKDGKRHVYSKRVLYIDEDTWACLASDKYDGNGDLWRVSWSYPTVAPEVPVHGTGFYTVSDLKKNGYYIIFGSFGKGSTGWNFQGEPAKDSFYTPAAMRRRGR